MTAVTGMCAMTGKPISGFDHVRQSLSRIVLTRIGTRIQRRDFGADILSLVSAPGNEATRVKTLAILAKAILTWEPRVKLSHILFNVDFDGRAVIEISALYKGEILTQSVPVSGLPASITPALKATA